MIEPIRRPRARMQTHAAQEDDVGTKLFINARLHDCIVIETPQGRVTVEVTLLNDYRVKLGFEGPVQIPIHRAEVLKEREGA